MGYTAARSAGKQVLPRGSLVSLGRTATAGSDITAKMSPKVRNPVDQQVGARLRKHRLAFGMTQERLGNLTGVSFQQVQKYEKGINRIGSSRLQQFATILKVSPAFFFEDTVAATSNSKTNAYADID